MENRRQIQGTVISNKSSKTIIVQVESYKNILSIRKEFNLEVNIMLMMN